MGDAPRGPRTPLEEAQITKFSPEMVGRGSKILLQNVARDWPPQNMGEESKFSTLSTPPNCPRDFQQPFSGRTVSIGLCSGGH